MDSSEHSCCQNISATENSPQDFAFALLEFKGNHRVWFKNPKLVTLVVGGYAVIEADRGEDAGLVRTFRSSFGCQPQLSPVPIIRAANSSDLAKIERDKEAEVTAFKQCAAKILNRNLPMKLIDVEYRMDGLKLTFYFASEGRIDFRELVRDLASAFKTRIELRQIGTRDEVKRSDGIGVCGQNFCCSNFLNNFHPITTGMAKAQNLILNPTKLSGRCGRLKCCLAFEMPNYADIECNHPGVELPSLNDSDLKMEILSD